MPLLFKKRVSTKHLATGVLTIAIVAQCQVSTAAFPHLPFLRAPRSEQKCTLTCGVESQFQPDIDVAQASKAISTCQNPTLGAKDGDRATLRGQQAEWTLGNKLASDLERQERLISDPITNSVSKPH